MSDPLGIFLATSGSRGDRILFRYPFETEEERKPCLRTIASNPYALRIEEDIKCNFPSLTGSLGNQSKEKGGLSWYTDRTLANLLAVKGGLCNSHFHVKINDVVFVGWPLSLQGSPGVASSGNTAGKRATPSILSLNVLFALKAVGVEHIAENYQKLAQQLAVALRHEERRCGYLSCQQQVMWAVQDEMATRTEADATESPYRAMLKKSSLAKTFKSVFDSLCTCGVVEEYVNRWIHISFCLPQKVHNLHLPPDSGLAIKPEAIYNCMEMMRPYHGVLLLVDESDLLASLPMDSSQALITLLHMITPLKNMQNLANDADLPLGQVYQLVSHLVYWNKAIIIYPLAETNMYVLAPNTNTYVRSVLSTEFAEEFHSKSLQEIMAKFSLPDQLGEHRDILGLPQEQDEQVKMVVYLLKKRLLIQLHTYVYLLPSTPLPTRSRAAIYLQLPSVDENNDNGSVLSEGSVLSSSLNSPPPGTVELGGGGSSDGSGGTTEGAWRTQDMLAGLDEATKHSVMNVPAAANPDDLKLFARLCPYFNGCHHLEEMMFYENVRRSQLLALLDKFRDVLITSQHEDPSTTGWIHR